MDINDIKNRMERVYLSLGKRFDYEIEKHIQIKHERNGTHGIVTISFEGNDKAEILNQIFVIISHLAKLKDHLKTLYATRGGNPKLIENEIEASEHLKLVIDLDNQEKHGSGKHQNRSGKWPCIDGVRRGLSAKPDGQNQVSSFKINPFTGEIETNGNVSSTINAEIKSKDGTRICYLDELVNKSMEKWEEIIKKYKLI